MAILGMMSEVMMLEIRFTLWLSKICFPTHIKGFKLVALFHLVDIKFLLMHSLEKCSVADP